MTKHEMKIVVDDSGRLLEIADLNGGKPVPIQDENKVDLSNNVTYVSLITYDPNVKGVRPKSCKLIGGIWVCT
jgi:hypothetical protein